MPSMFIVNIWSHAVGAAPPGFDLKDQLLAVGREIRLGVFPAGGQLLDVRQMALEPVAEAETGRLRLAPNPMATW